MRRTIAVGASDVPIWITDNTSAMATTTSGAASSQFRFCDFEGAVRALFRS